MSWQQYLELPEKPRAEWVDGVALIMNAPPLWAHSDSTLRLGALLLAALPRHHVGTEAALKLPRNRVRLPDLMVIEKVPADGWVVEPPLMVAEVLSRSTRSEDLVRKSVEYREAGVGQYWLVDPELRTLEVMANGEDAWETVLRLDDDHPEGSVVLAGTTIPLDLRVILRADAN
jgi:Uma2 family endonuclease